MVRALAQTGRDTLQRTIEIVNNHPEWGAKVVYGDTDSLFVLLDGRSRAEAFAVGREIARVITRANPYPVELEMEKVYHPCMMCTKKRYAGWMYESETGIPMFDARGIETVRRDGCAAEREVLQQCLRLLFTTSDLSTVKSYVVHQCSKLHNGRISLVDYIIASELWLGTYKSPHTPGAQVALQRQEVDPNDKVQLGERVPYVVIRRQDGDPRLCSSAEPPEVVLFPACADYSGVRRALQPNAAFYIFKRILPALDRVFSLVGVDVYKWYTLETKRSSKHTSLDRPLRYSSSWDATIVGYFNSEGCVLCGNMQCRGLLCGHCNSSHLAVTATLTARRRLAEQRYNQLLQHCMRCADVRGGPVQCRSLDCSMLYLRSKLTGHAATAAAHAGRGLLW
jgi:DNA polymerase zeta